MHAKVDECCCRVRDGGSLLQGSRYIVVGSVFAWKVICFHPCTQLKVHDIGQGARQGRGSCEPDGGVKVDKGVADVSLMVESARETTHERENALREQVNESLAKIRAYARDMEVGQVHREVMGQVYKKPITFTKKPWRWVRFTGNPWRWVRCAGIESWIGRAQARPHFLLKTEQMYGHIA
eukprot:scaffold140417_cov18-Tisochrysis_lutea.AAC.1